MLSPIGVEPDGAAKRVKMPAPTQHNTANNATARRSRPRLSSHAIHESHIKANINTNQNSHSTAITRTHPCHTLVQAQRHASKSRAPQTEVAVPNPTIQYESHTYAQSTHEVATLASACEQRGLTATTRPSEQQQTTSQISVLSTLFIKQMLPGRSPIHLYTIWLVSTAKQDHHRC